MTAAEISLSRTKIIVPALRKEILHRPRLLAHFDDLLDKKLIIVVAPAGYGKTSLLVDFARLSEMPVCWLSLDALDKDPQRFFAYLIAALKQRFPKFGKQSNAVLRSLTSFEGESERLLSALVNEIESQIGEHFTLMVDDYQNVDSIASIRDLFSRFIYLAGENCHIVLSSRRLPTLPDITLMVAHQQVAGFDLEQLAFRAEEIRALFEMDYGVKLTDSAVEELMRQTEGWITGLHLSAGSVEQGVPDLTQTARSTGVDLATYLDQQVLAPQSPRLRKFLLQTSLLEEFDADLCEAVFGKGDWKSLLKTIRESNLFVLSVGPGGKWLRYHHLFREFLLERIREEDAEKVQAILTRLAEVYTEREEWEKAYAIYRQLGDSDLLANLIEIAGTPMLLNERLVTLRTWLEELPAHLLEERPPLVSLRGALLCALGEGSNALSLLDRAIPEIERTGDAPALALAHVRRAAAYRLVGNYAKSLQDSDEALRLCKNKAKLQAIYAEAERFRGLASYHLGQITKAVQLLEDALQRYDKLGEEQSKALVQMELGMAYRANDDFTAAHSAYMQALNEWRRENNMHSQANVLNNLGVLYHYQGEYERAVQAYEAGLDCVKFSHSYWHESLLLTSLGDVFCDLDEYESADQAYERAGNAANQVNYQFLIDYIHIAKSRLARLRGQVKEAQLFLSEAELAILGSDSKYECGLFYFELGSINLMQKGHNLAVANLKRSLDYFQQSGLVVEIFGNYIWLAVAYLGLGKYPLARSCVQKALKVQQTESMPSPFLQILRRARPWLATLLEDTEMGISLRVLLTRASKIEAQMPTLRARVRRSLHTIPIGAPRLVIHAFGKPRVWVNGRIVKSEQWKTASVRELFFYLLAALHPLTKEEIGAALWPELDASQLKLRFKNEMYRLRRALGQDVILFENEHYHFNRHLDYEYDVENFSSQLIKARAAAQRETKAAHLRAATAPGYASYLQGVGATWVWPEREGLERAYVSALQQLAEIQHAAGDARAALQTCQDALKISPCREDIHCFAMQLHAEMGDRLAVIWQYRACQSALRSELGVDPSEETDALYRRLIASGRYQKVSQV